MVLVGPNAGGFWARRSRGEGAVVNAERADRDQASWLGAELLKDILDVVPDAMLIADDQGTIRAVNGQLEHLFGYAVGELCGQQVEVLLPRSVRAGHQASRLAFARNPRRRPMAASAELHGLRKDGSEFPAEVSLAPLQTSAGSMVTAAVRDVTERRRAMEQERELQLRLQQLRNVESLSALAGGVAHDFNNLLVGIVGNVGLALRSVPTDSPVRALLCDMEVAAQRATHLAGQMLAFSGKGKFLVERLDLNALVERVLGSDSSVRTALAHDLPRVDADAVQLEQVLRALLANAREAAVTGPVDVLVSTGVEVLNDAAVVSAPFEQAPAGTYVSLEVRDDGCGMDAVTRDRMFEPFFSSKFPGRGLGLAAVLGIVRGHHGAIAVSSSVGNGTTVKVLLPVPASTTGVDPKLSMRIPRPAREQTILVVDDESHVRRALRSMLLALGFSSVVTAADGYEALDVYRARRESIRAVLLDVTMPRMGGVEALGALRSIDRRVQVLMMSGYCEEHALAGANRANLRGFLQKPFTLEQLALGLSRLEPT